MQGPSLLIRRLGRSASQLRPGWTFTRRLIRYLAVPQWHRLRQLAPGITEAPTIGLSDRLYRTLIRRLDPLCPLREGTAIRFMSKGQGRGNLTVSRCVRVGDQIVVEKVYDGTSADLARMLAFYQSRFVLEVQTPRLVQTPVPSRLVPAYFEYLPDFQPATSDDTLAFSDDFTRWAHRRYGSVSGPDWLCDFTADECYQARRQKLCDFARHHLGDQGVRFVLRAEGILIRSRNRVVCHGDIKPDNLSSRGELIDWDRFGYYPLGYDYAFTLSNCFGSRDVPKLLDALDQHVRKYDRLAEHCDLSLTYFTLLFSCNSSGTFQAGPEHQTALFERLRQIIGRSSDRIAGSQS